MSTASGSVSTLRKPIGFIPATLWMPLLGMAWVFFNVLMVWLGIRLGYRLPCSLVAGGVDGGILASIALATLGEKIHAGTAGLLSGYGFHDVASKFDLTQKYAQWLHEHLEPLLALILGPSEMLHQMVQNQLVGIACTAAFVVMATLVVQLIRNAGAERQ